MKKYKLLTILFISILVLTGCSKNKKSITAEDFSQAASDKGYVLSDVSSLYGIANKAYQTREDEFTPFVLFIEGNKISDIQAMFLDESINIYKKAGIKDEYESQEVGTLTTKAPQKTILSGDGWESLEVDNGLKYYYVIYVNKTILYMEGSTDQKDKLRELKDTIKY